MNVKQRERGRGREGEREGEGTGVEGIGGLEKEKGKGGNVISHRLFSVYNIYTRSRVTFPCYCSKRICRSQRVLLQLQITGQTLDNTTQIIKQVTLQWECQCLIVPDS